MGEGIDYELNMPATKYITLFATSRTSPRLYSFSHMVLKERPDSPPSLLYITHSIAPSAVGVFSMHSLDHETKSLVDGV